MANQLTKLNYKCSKYYRFYLYWKYIKAHWAPRHYNLRICD